MGTIYENLVAEDNAWVNNRFANFMHAAKGLTAWRTALIVNRVGTPGTDWRGCNKSVMAKTYAKCGAKLLRGSTFFSEAVIEALRQAPRAE